MVRQRHYSSNWIDRLESFDHWKSYWHQAKLMEGHVKKGDTIVEIGIGSGFLSNYLRSKGVKVITLDIDKKKSPDIVIDAVDFYPRRSFDYLCAFELFEHLQFHEMGTILDNVQASVDKGIFVSLPTFTTIIVRVELKLPFSKKIDFNITMPKRGIRAKHHRWELGFKDFTKKRLAQEFRERGFSLEEDFKYLKRHFFYFLKDGSKVG